ncbi:MAG: sulfatase [Owenweeksia sp.]
MNKIWMFPVLLGLAASCANPQEPATEEPEESKKPNIIFIMTDDHAYQAISAYNEGLIETPNIDRLAREGMLFQRGFVTNSICAPSRAVALTGKFSHMNGLKDNLDTFDSTQVTFPRLLQKEGYKTAVIGKWHLKTQPMGFDYWKVLPDQGQYYHPEFRTKSGMVKEQGYVTDVVTDISMQWLDSVRQGDEPFLLMYQHKAPHREWWPNLPDIEEFTGKEFPEPATLFDDYEGRGRAAKETEMTIHTHMALSSDNKVHPDIVNKLGYKSFMNWYQRIHLAQYNRLSDEEKAKWDEYYGPINKEFEKLAPQGKELTQWKYQRYMQDYLGTIRSVDDNVGRLLEYLDSNGLAENTIVVYTSDQGFYLGEHGWFDKRFMYEESFRTPLIVRWPGKIKAGTVDKHLVQNLDFAPTFLDAAGVNVPGDMQGRSLLPVFAEEADDWRDGLYYHYYEYPGFHMVKRHYGIRTDRYKLIHFYYDIDEWELYDLEKDPQEMKNQYDNPEYADIQKKLHGQLSELREQYMDNDSVTQAMLNADIERAKRNSIYSK